MAQQIINALAQGTVLHGKAYSYIIEKPLGQGSFGITYLAKIKMKGELGSIDSNIFVAIKEFFMKEINGRNDSTVISSNNDGLFVDYRKKFTREATNLGKLKHQNIIKVLECFEENNTVYYSMEYIDGGNLNDYIEQAGRIPEHEVIELTKQIGNAISFMHQKKMIHLDLKPANIMRKKDGSMIIIDFGLSKQYNDSGDPESSTTVGRGTPGYAPIEQTYYQDGHDFPATMDVYALGATMYKMLTGRRPIDAPTILNEGFPHEDMLSLGISETITSIVEKAMKPVKSNRFQTISELISCLSASREESTISTKPIRISAQVTSVKIHFDEGSISNGNRIDFIANRNGKSKFIQSKENEKLKSIELNSFDWDKFVAIFNSLGLNEVKSLEGGFKGGHRTKIQLRNEYDILLDAEQQKEGSRISGNLSGNILPLLNYIQSIPEIKEKDKTSSLENSIFRKYLSKALTGLIIGLSVVFIKILIDESKNKTKTETRNDPLRVEIISINVENFEYKDSSGKLLYYWTGKIDKNNKPNSIGTAIYPSDDKDGRESYIGEMKNGLRCGNKATLKYTNGDIFEGSFTNDSLANGRLQLKTEKMYYIGTFKENEPWNGKWYHADGKEYSIVNNGVEK